jgi:DNA polymerase III delta subunit
MADKFSMDQLQKIYNNIFEIDFESKTGKIDPEMALEIFIAKI